MTDSPTLSAREEDPKAAPAEATPGHDYEALAGDLGEVPHDLSPAKIKRRMRDFFWYSPRLKEQLSDLPPAGIVIFPRGEDDVVTAAGACARRGIPLTVRGAGTGNYGQAVPLSGGAILDMTGMAKVLDVGAGSVRVEPGKLMLALDDALAEHGYELRMYPSTRRTASVGGFIAGGSGGVGSLRYGILADPGQILGVRVVTMEETPRVLDLTGADIQKVNHAYGTNGIITALHLPVTAKLPWRDMIATFDDFMTAARFCQQVSENPALDIKELCLVAAPAPQQYFTPLKDHLPDGQHVVLGMVCENAVDPYSRAVEEAGGTLTYHKTEAETKAENRFPLYEYAWNHTTLQALKADRSITYLQTLFAPGDHLDKIEHMYRQFGDEVPMHLEFVRIGGAVGCFGLQLVRYTDEKRLMEIIDYHEAHGCPIFNPHTYVLEDGGMKEVDWGQVAFKKEADPHGLLNPGKMRGWEARDQV